jgi:hypothetical protein
MPKKSTPPDAKNAPTVGGAHPWVPPDTPQPRERLVATNRGAPAASRPSAAPLVGGVSTALPTKGKSVTYANIVGNTSVVQVVVPGNVKPGQNFQAHTKHGTVHVNCPAKNLPGQTIPVIVALGTISDISHVANVPTPTTGDPVSLLQNTHHLFRFYKSNGILCLRFSLSASRTL